MKSTYRLNGKAATKQLLSLGDWVRWSVSVFNEADIFFGHGTDNAWDEAIQLILPVLHLKFDTDPKVFNTRLLDYEKKRLLIALRERVDQRKPLPYITNQAWCCGLPFYVDERVLIPRSPFSEWIEKCFEPWIQPENVSNILEIGTGSACLAIAAALHFPESHCDAVDVSTDALEVAKINVDKHDVADRVSLLHSDIFSSINADSRYDIIFSNPPYVSQAEMDSLPPEYRHEPREALQAPEQGLAIVTKILQESASHLRDQGILVVEVGHSAEALQQRFPKVPFTWLQQDRGGEGLFMLTKAQLTEYFY